jgi:hypothetical protein
MPEITNTTKSFEIVVDSSIEALIVRELTLKEREKLFQQFEENIKSRRRKEYLEIAKLMEGKDKTKDLVECANANVVQHDDLVTEAQTVYGITETLNLAGNKKHDWSNILSNEDTIPNVLKAFYYAFGIEIPDESPTEEVKGDAKQGDFFEKIETKKQKVKSLA